MPATRSSRGSWQPAPTSRGSKSWKASAISADDGSTHETMFSLQNDLALLEERIQARDNCRLVVIDPITAYLGRSDSHRNSEMRALLAPLSELAARTGVAVLAVNHLNKMGQGPAIYRSMGSLAFAATARSVLAVMCDPNDAASRVLVSLKSNVSAEVQGMRFQMMTDAESTAGIEPGGERPMPTIRWSDTPLAMTAEEIISAAAQSAECGPALDEACEWLRSVLTTGPQAAVELKRIAKEDGIRERTLVRAKQRLGVLAARTGFGLGGSWMWRLPESKSGDGKQSDRQLPDA
jgi:putative DNA primase/helicase